MANQLTRLKLFTFLCFSVCLLVLLIPADARAQQDWNIASQAISSSEAANDPHESEGDQESSDAPTVLSPDRSENDATEGASDSAGSPAPTRDSVSISLRTAIFAGSFESSSLGLADGVVLAPHVHAQYQHRLGLRLIAGAHLLLAPSLTETPIMGDETNSLHLVVGNPYIGASHWWGSMRVGGVLFAPLTRATPVDTSFGMGMFSRDPWAWFTEQLTILGTLSWQDELTPEFNLEIEGRVGFAYSLENSDETSFAFEAFTRLEYRLAPTLRLFTAMSLVYNANVPDEFDSSQLGVLLGGSWVQNGIEVELALSMPIDDPLGFAFSADGIFGLQLALGWSS